MPNITRNKTALSHLSTPDHAPSMWVTCGVVELLPASSTAIRSNRYESPGAPNSHPPPPAPPATGQTEYNPPAPPTPPRHSSASRASTARLRGPTASTACPKRLERRGLSPPKAARPPPAGVTAQAGGRD